MTKLIEAFRSFAKAHKNLTDITSLFTVNVAGMMDMSKQAHVGKSEGQDIIWEILDVDGWIVLKPVCH